jgi:hypothetical protein
MNPTKLNQLIRFLQDDLAVPASSVRVALRHPECSSHLPMILWQYGLISLEQLDQVFTWLEMA